MLQDYESRVLDLLDSILLKVESIDSFIDQISSFVQSIAANWLPILSALLVALLIVCLVKWVVKL